MSHLPLSAPRKATTRVALILDNPKRDLDGLALVACQLLHRGARPTVVPMYQQGYDLPLLTPDVVLVNYARLNNKDLLATYRAIGSRVAVMDTEGGVLSEQGADSPENWARHFRVSGFADLVDGYFFWGEKVRAAFLADSGLPADALQVTGCPRYDVCALPWRNALVYSKDGYVLINTNFSSINPIYTRSDDREKWIFKDLGWEASYVDRLFSDLTAVFPRYLDILVRLARDNPSLSFLVRPHPFENPAPYRECFGGVSNVEINGDGNILPVIAHASLVLHLNCGSAVETNLLGKVPVSLEFLNTNTMRRHAPLPSKISCHAEGYDDLCAWVRDPAECAARHDPALVMKGHIAPWFGPLDGRASQRLADGLLELAPRSTHTRRPSLARSLRGGRSPAAPGRLAQGVLANLLGTQVMSGLRHVLTPARRGKSVTASDVAGRIDHFAALASLGLEYTCRHARHPITGLPLTSIELVPKGAP